METTTDLTVETAFDTFQEVVDADPDLVSQARERRSTFRAAFEGEPDVSEFINSGSLERKTQRDPMNDVDVIVVYDAELHTDWNIDGDGSAERALNYTREQVKRLLNDNDGESAQFVRLTRVRNHAVKCFIDDPDDPDAFTVDVMPALRQDDGTLRVPEVATDSWISTDPEFLIREVATRQEEWEHFVPLVRVIKYWSEHAGVGMKSLVCEVLALTRLPAAESRPLALQQFFTAASLAVLDPIEDPSGHCGVIQPDLDRDHAHELLEKAASLSWKAVNAEAAGETDRAICFWQEVFGDEFPEPACGCGGDDTDDGVKNTVNIGVGTVGLDYARQVVDTPQG